MSLCLWSAVCILSMISDYYRKQHADADARIRALWIVADVMIDAAELLLFVFALCDVIEAERRIVRMGLGLIMVVLVVLQTVAFNYYPKKD